MAPISPHTNIEEPTAENNPYNQNLTAAGGWESNFWGRHRRGSLRAGGCRRDERTERVEEREAGDGKSGGWEDRIAPAHVQLIFDRLDGVIRRFTICIGHENMSGW